MPADLRVPGYLGRVLRVDGTPAGTCFQVEPGVLVTAWHVLDSDGPVLVDPLGGGPARPARVVRVDSVHDLAVLTVTEPLAASVTLVETDGRPVGLRVVVTGMGQLDDPDYTYRYLEAPGRWAGAARRDDVALARVESSGLLLGMSGAPVRRQGDDAVVGIVSGRYNSVDGWARDSVWVARVEDLMPLLDGVTGVVLDKAFPLRDYLDDAVRAAQSHPYPGAGHVRTAPPLTTVYVHQRTGDGRLPAEVVLDGDQDCVVSAGPGTGKSCLLRSALIGAARQWDDGGTGREIPVRVLAADIASTPRISEAIAASANIDLGSVIGRERDLPAELFASAPLPGVRWLVLVDGLDEVIDPARRRAVVDKLVGSAGSPYRFVVATRDLAELDERDDWTRHTYELLPFTASQLPGFAQSWFTALGLADPAEAAVHFLAAVRRASMSIQARNPLLATILCQLYAQDPLRPLPPGRSQAFEQYVDLLTSQPYRYRDGGKHPGGLAAQTSAALDRFGSAAVTAGDVLLARFPNDVGWLAATRLDGDTRTAPDLFTERTAGTRPGNVPEGEWRSFLSDLLRRSGVFIERGHDFVFLHHTVTEFLAARYTVADRDRSAEAFRDFTRQTREHRWSVRRSWDKTQGDSYARFLVAAWHSRDDLPSTLRGLAARDLFGCVFVADLVDDRTPVDPTVLAAATRKLTAVAGGADVTDRVLAMLTLSRLGDPSGAELLSALLDDAIAGRVSRTDAITAMWVEMLLREQPPPRFAELLAAEAADPATDSVFRAEAMSQLAKVDNTAGAAVLLASTNDPTLSWAERLVAAEQLVKLGDQRGADALAAHSVDPAVTQRDRRAAARTLADAGDTRGAAALATQAGSGAAEDRLAAARTLVCLDDPRGAEALYKLANESTVDDENRRQAAKALAEHGDARGNQALVAQASVSAKTDTRWRAARTLVELGDERGTGLLAAVETNRATTVARDRAWSAREGMNNLGVGEFGTDRSRTARHNLLLIKLNLARQLGPSFRLVRNVWSLSVREQHGLPYRVRYTDDIRAAQSWTTPSSVGRSTWRSPGPVTGLIGLLVLVVPFAAWFLAGAAGTALVVVAVLIQPYVILLQRVTFIVLFSKKSDPWPVFAFGWLVAAVAGLVFRR